LKSRKILHRKWTDEKKNFKIEKKLVYIKLGRKNGGNKGERERTCWGHLLCLLRNGKNPRKHG